MSSEDGWLSGHIREVPDFPKPGISFKDISPLLRDGAAFGRVVDELDAALPSEITTVIGVEARGFIFGAALAHKRRIGFVPIRKQGKLPGPTHSIDFELEYGHDALEIQAGLVGESDRVVLIDDVLATGGTACAAADLLGRCGAQLAAIGFVIELSFLDGRRAVLTRTDHLDTADIVSLLTYG